MKRLLHFRGMNGRGMFVYLDLLSYAELASREQLESLTKPYFVCHRTKNKLAPHIYIYTLYWGKV